MAQTVMRVTGWVLIVAGLGGFVHSLPGFMELTVLHNLVHLGTGVAALLAAGSGAASLTMARVLGSGYLLLALLGHVSPFLFRNQLPLTPFDTFLHWTFVAIFLYAGFFAPTRATAR